MERPGPILHGPVGDGDPVVLAEVFGPASQSDPDQKACNLYGVFKEKSMYGRKYMGVERSTFLIDSKGVLRLEWRKVKVKDHAEAVLAAVKAL